MTEEDLFGLINTFRRNLGYLRFAVNVRVRTPIWLEKMKLEATYVSCKCQRQWILSLGLVGYNNFLVADFFGK